MCNKEHLFEVVVGCTVCTVLAISRVRLKCNNNTQGRRLRRLGHGRCHKTSSLIWFHCTPGMKRELQIGGNIFGTENLDRS